MRRLQCRGLAEEGDRLRHEHQPDPECDEPPQARRQLTRAATHAKVRPKPSAKPASDSQRPSACRTMPVRLAPGTAARSRLTDAEDEGSPRGMRVGTDGHPFDDIGASCVTVDRTYQAPAHLANRSGGDRASGRIGDAYPLADRIDVLVEAKLDARGRPGEHCGRRWCRGLEPGVSVSERGHRQHAARDNGHRGRASHVTGRRPQQAAAPARRNGRQRCGSQDRTRRATAARR